MIVLKCFYFIAVIQFINQQWSSWLIYFILKALSNICDSLSNVFKETS